MTFLNPLFLLALGLIFIPVIIHLFNLRKARRVNFSSLMFVKHIEETRMRKLRLKELILLLIRVAFIVFLVLSFSNPVLESSFSPFALKNKTLFLFVDNSFSLDNSGGNQNLLDKCRKISSEIFSTFSPTDNSLIYKGTENQIKPDEIDTIGVSVKPFLINKVFNEVNSVLARNPSVLNEVIIVSDFKKVNLIYTNEKYENISGRENLFFYLLDVSERDFANVSVQNVISTDEFADVNSELDFEIQIKNHNNFPVSSVEFVITDNNIRVYSVFLDFMQEELKTVNVRFKPVSEGFNLIKSELKIVSTANDELKYDNYFYNVIDIPSGYKVLIVTENIENQKYISGVFNTLNSRGGKNTIEYTTSVSVPQNINNYSTAFLFKSEYSESEINLIENFINSDKGVFIFPSSDMILTSVNSLLGRISSFRYSELIRPSADFMISAFNIEHPLLKGVFKIPPEKNIFLPPESPKINSYYGILSGSYTFPVISFNNESTFVAEYKKEKSSVLISALPPDLTMSDLPLKNIFLPLIIRGVYLLSGNSKINKTERITEVSAAVNYFSEMDTLISPSGKKYNLLNNREEILPMNSDIFQESGIYKLTSTGGSNSYFALNCDSSESNQEKIQENSAIKYFEQAGFKNIGYYRNSDELKSDLLRNRKGIELTPFLLLIAIILLIFEIYYSHKLSSKNI